MVLHSLRGGSADRAQHHAGKWGFPKIMGTFFGGPHFQDYNILGSMLGSPYFGKLPGILAPVVADFQASGLRKASKASTPLWIENWEDLRV